MAKKKSVADQVVDEVVQDDQPVVDENVKVKVTLRSQFSYDFGSGVVVGTVEDKTQYEIEQQEYLKNVHKFEVVAE